MPARTRALHCGVQSDRPPFLCRECPLLSRALELRGRRLRGLATVTERDVREFRKYPESIARSSWNIDIQATASYTVAAVDRSSDEAKRGAGDALQVRAPETRPSERSMGSPC